MILLLHTSTFNFKADIVKTVVQFHYTVLIPNIPQAGWPSPLSSFPVVRRCCAFSGLSTADGSQAQSLESAFGGAIG